LSRIAKRQASALSRTRLQHERNLIAKTGGAHVSIPDLGHCVPRLNRPAKPGDAPDGSITIFEAFDKQMSLKLEASKQPMPVVVIEKAEQKPIEN
jgi:uncharacterized protein DUF3738